VRITGSCDPENDWDLIHHVYMHMYTYEGCSGPPTWSQTIYMYFEKPNLQLSCADRAYTMVDADYNELAFDLIGSTAAVNS